MELIKQPQTELDYWEIIEFLGGFIWRLNHDLAAGRIDDPKGKIAQDIKVDARQLQKRLNEASEKFGIILPENCPRVEPGKEAPPAPEGKIYYWDWYYKMKDIAYRADYEKIICSACPFSEGVEIMKIGVIPCGIFRGTVYGLNAPYACAMLTSLDVWTEEKLCCEIFNQHGMEALKKFTTKLKELKAAAKKQKLG